jgi:hypothetical protein
MRIDKIAGLPAHPLFVHIPVVLLPLVAIGAIAMACSARVRDRLGWVVLGLSIAAGLSTQLAIGSGKALVDSVTKSSTLDQHIAIAESIRPLALLLFLVALGVMLVDRRTRAEWPFQHGSQTTTATWVNVALVSITVTVALVTCGRLYQIGDTGAKATWQNTRLVPAHENGAS